MSPPADNPASNDLIEVLFVDGLKPEGQGDRRPPRMSHKKSRTGCQRCRARRVKCNEEHPACGNCQRHKFPCFYDRAKHLIDGSHAYRTRKEDSSSGTSHSVARSISPDESRGVSTPVENLETKQRRLLELRLLNHFISVAGPTLSSDPITSEAFTRTGPKLALTNDGLLYAILALAAFHAGRFEPDSSEFKSAYQLYYRLAVIEHRKDVMKGMNADNVGVIVLASTMIRICAFVELQERVMDPYEPPYRVFQMVHGAGAIFKEASNICGNDHDSFVSHFLSRLPIVKNESLLCAETSRRGLLHLLRRTSADEEEETWSEAIQHTYESTLSILGSVWDDMEVGEQPPDVIRRMAMMPMSIEPAFNILVKEQKPRALVIIAHYFGIISMFQHICWVGASGPREVLAIYKVLPPAWLDLMAWPMEAVKRRVRFDSTSSARLAEARETDAIREPLWKTLR